MSLRCSFSCLTALTLQMLCVAHGTFGPRAEKEFAGPLPQEAHQHLNTSALNTLLAFEPYHGLASRVSTEPEAQQRNILFSPLGLASAVVLLSRVSRSESRSQALELLGLAANSTERSVEDAVSSLTDLLHNLTLPEGRGGGGGRGAGSEAGAGTTAGDGDGGSDAGGRADAAEAGTHAGSQLKKDLESSDELELNNYAYFKGRLPFERRHTVPRSFQLNATASLEVAMMFRDDSSDVMMLYDTNCSATVVQLAQSERLAWLLLLPKAELQTLEGCLSSRRMSFWLSNLKPGRAEILFPKFQLRRSYNVKNLLKNSGASSLFSDAPDFSGLSEKETLRLVKASQEVMLEVEEAKLEEGGGYDVPLDFSVPPRITFNRPFVLLTYDHVTGLVLLMGRISDPADV
uniref:Alpha-1-antiproteinase-like n=1 Tax=Takifugu rubripes TaxID=31033 RepID=A0A674NQ01_TAKRU